MSIAAVLAMDTPKRRRELSRRPPTDLERLRHIRAAYDYYVGPWTPPEVALLHGVSRSTVHEWARLALTYDDPEAEGLRRRLGVEKPPA